MKLYLKTLKICKKEDLISDRKPPTSKPLYIFKQSHLYVMSGCKGINSAGPNSIEQPEVTNVSNSPIRVSKRNEPRFNMQTKKRLLWVQLMSATQYDLAKIEEN